MKPKKKYHMDRDDGVIRNERGQIRRLKDRTPCSVRMCRRHAPYKYRQEDKTKRQLIQDCKDKDAVSQYLIQ